MFFLKGGGRFGDMVGLTVGTSWGRDRAAMVKSASSQNQGTKSQGLGLGDNSPNAKGGPLIQKGRKSKKDGENWHHWPIAREGVYI